MANSFFFFFFSFSFGLSGLTLVLWLEGPVGTLSDCARVTSKVDDRPMGGDSDGEGRGPGVIAPGGMIREFCLDCLVFFWPWGLRGLTRHSSPIKANQAHGVQIGLNRITLSSYVIRREVDWLFRIYSARTSKLCRYLKSTKLIPQYSPMVVNRTSFKMT